MCLLVRGVVGKPYSWKDPWLPTGTHFPGMSGTQLPFSQHTLPGEPQPPTTALMLSCPSARLRESWKGLLGDRVVRIICIKAGTSAFPVGFSRWQINEDSLRGLSRMRLWR